MPTLAFPMDGQNFTELPDFNETQDSNVTAESIAWRPLWQVITLGFLLSIVVLVTVSGNLLVIVTVLTQKRLQYPTNFFILSLAVTDFLLGSFVLPLSAVNTLHSKWPFGPVFCNIYMSTDVMLSTVSILNLFAISIDRYSAVTSPLSYQRRVSSRLVWKVCAAIWTFSFLLAFIPIHLGWNTMDGSVQNYNDPSQCLFELNKVYVLVDSLGTYFGPLIVMCCVYLKVLIITKRQVQEINKLQKAGYARGMLRSEESRHQRMASDTKATITLSSLVLAFAICWIPYFAIFTAKPFISTPINVHLDLFVLWLGYVNSLINPFLYAYYNSAFRDAFARVLCRTCITPPRSDVSYMAATYKTSFGDQSEMSALNGRLPT